MLADELGASTAQLDEGCNPQPSPLPPPPASAHFHQAHPCEKKAAVNPRQRTGKCFHLDFNDFTVLTILKYFPENPLNYSSIVQEGQCRTPLNIMQVLNGEVLCLFAIVLFKQNSY